MEQATRQLNQPITYEIEMPNPALSHYRLLGNGAQMNCPFKTISMIPTPGGQFGAIQHSCSTDCPLVELVEVEDVITYTINCGSNPISRIVTEKAEEIIHRIPSIITP